MSAVIDQAATFYIYSEPATYPQPPPPLPPWKVEPPPLSVLSPPLPPPVPPHLGGGTYTVQPGDNLWDIAQHLLKNPTLYPLIQAANHIGANAIIYPGQQLSIPSLPADLPQGSVAVIVRPGDTVWGFAGGDPALIQRIAELNHLEDPALIYKDQVLIIPPAA